MPIPEKRLQTRTLREIPKSYGDSPIAALTDETIDCEWGHSDYGESALCQQLFSRLQIQDFQQYSSPSRQLLALNSVCQYLGVSLPHDQIFFGNGANHLLEKIFTYLYPQCRMLGVGPQFVHAIKHCISHGGQYTAIHRQLSRV
jgi:histidinol-phosphate/aromatic aminotransferase/cobyric acid decarboxylase-like protein